MKTDKKIGIALSGGGARGIAHIGVLKALENNHIFPSYIAGTSAGSIVGALYAAGHSPKKMMEIAKVASLFKIFKMGIPYAGLTKLTYLKEVLSANIESDSFEALQKKLFVTISNLNTGTIEWRSSGPLFDVVTASCSIPLLFQPVEMDGQLYVDGGLLDNLPVEPLHGKVDIIIAVNVMPNIALETKNIQNVFSIAMRCFDLSILANSRPNLKLCDFLIEPKELNDYNIFQFSSYQEMYEIGYKAAAAQIGAIKTLIDNA
ncbi:MAG TPA: patatin-like phospholipase family protein [Saprospiraceae bacterium]|nr:patatin-like phospholipase family protein [Saprospiraceae bacterium]HMQ84981.1 patatin-like phospholipase family protein [Saprospiraceae bacterium]